VVSFGYAASGPIAWAWHQTSHGPGGVSA